MTHPDIEPARKLWQTIAEGICPACNRPSKFAEGARGGLSINITCGNVMCQARFNVTPVVQIAERI